MKRSLLAIAALALSATTALAAKPHYLYRGGGWTTYVMTSNDGSTPLCGMQVTGSDKSMYVKYINGSGKVAVQLFKDSWRFPKDGVEVPITVGFDKNAMVEGKATGLMTDSANPMVLFTLKGELADGFLKEFGEANQMWVKFAEGDEDPWVADMRGSRGAVKAFRDCSSALMKNFPSADSPSATQPYAAPKAPQATQPYGKQPASGKSDKGDI